MTNFKYNEAVLIIEGAYISSMVSALTGPKVSTSAPYNYSAFINHVEDIADVRKIIRITFIDAMPYKEVGNEISEKKMEKARKYHAYLRKFITQNGARTKVIVGRTEKTGDSFKQVGVNTEMVNSIHYYHSKYAINVPLIIVSADPWLKSAIAQVMKDGRDVILIGADNSEKNLFYKETLRQTASDFISLAVEDVMAFKDSPRWKEEQQKKLTEQVSS